VRGVIFDLDGLERLSFQWGLGMLIGDKIPLSTKGSLPDCRSQLDLLSFGMVTSNRYVGSVCH
jgi:hypothetical protein